MTAGLTNESQPKAPESNRSASRNASIQSQSRIPTQSTPEPISNPKHPETNRSPAIVVRAQVSPGRLGPANDLERHQTVEDAKECGEIGVQGIVMSNHEGRQQEGVNSSLEVLPQTVRNEVYVFFDPRIRSLADIARHWLWQRRCASLAGLMSTDLRLEAKQESATCRNQQLATSS